MFKIISRILLISIFITFFGFTASAQTKETSPEYQDFMHGVVDTNGTACCKSCWTAKINVIGFSKGNHEKVDVEVTFLDGSGDVVSYEGIPRGDIKDLSGKSDVNPDSPIIKIGGFCSDSKIYPHCFLRPRPKG